MMTTSLPSQSASSPRSVISRIASPFKAKARNISDFHIEPDEPFRPHYAPGETIKGSVFLTVCKPFRITHLVLSLHGFVKVYKSGHAPKDGKSREAGFLGPGRGTRGPEYMGKGFASIFEDEVVLCGEGRLIANTYAFKFELQFPSSRIPSSIRVSFIGTAHLRRTAS